MFIRTFVTGIRRSRPVCITCSKTQSNSSQVSGKLSNKGQSNEHIYLPISALFKNKLFRGGTPFSHQR